MKNIQYRIETLAKVSEQWLTDDNKHVLRAVQNTVYEGYFSFPDVQYALKVLKESFTKQALEQWVERSGITDENDARGKNVLCLHAGNLPLVGFQNALAVLLSGARYSGKISRKDPYLLPTFLNEVKKTELWGGIDVQWTHQLDDFEGMPHDAVLFAGSEQSVPDVRAAIDRYNLTKKEVRYLIRTAHFSMAYIDNISPEIIEELTEAILRYGGKGCRSVAVVVSPCSLNDIKDELTDAITAFWEEYPQHAKPTSKLRQRFAYNKGVERPQLWLKNYLLQQNGLELDQDFICYWVEGDEKKVTELSDTFGGRLQSVYKTKSGIQIPGESNRVEFLADAQRPPIFWKPDGTDSLKWLCR